MAIAREKREEGTKAVIKEVSREEMEGGKHVMLQNVLLLRIIYKSFNIVKCITLVNAQFVGSVNKGRLVPFEHFHLLQYE